MTHIPYHGAVHALLAVVRGDEAMYVGTIATALPFIKSGKLKALAIMQQARSSFLPDVPSIAELGYKGVNAGTYYGIFAPAGTPQSIVAKLSNDIKSALSKPEVTKTMHTLGDSVVGAGPDEFARFLKTNFKKWKEAAAIAGITPH